MDASAARIGKGFMAKRSPPRQTAKPFESNNPLDTYATIHHEMQVSTAWRNLTAQQKALYMACKDRYRCKGRNTPSYTDENGKLQKHEYWFYMNRSLWADEYKLYAASSHKSFVRDMSALIKAGFTDCILPGQKGKRSSIYSFSARWQKDDPTPTREQMNDSLLHAIAKRERVDGKV
jgi:hypothetical protein